MNLDEGINFGKTIIGGADGPTSVFLAGTLGTTATVVIIVIGLLFCFLGLKLSKLLVPITGFLMGAAVGCVVSTVAKADGTASMVIILVCAVLLAALSAFLYKLGIFLFVFTAVLMALASFFGISGVLSITISAGGEDMIVKCIMLGAALVLAVLAVIYVEPVVVIATAVSGGMSAGPMILIAAGFNGQAWAGCLAGAALTVLGLLVQFMMHSRKVGKKEKIYADEIKEKDSVESEVEKARTVLEEDEEEE